MAGETGLDLSLTVSVPGGNPAIAVTAPLTRPRRPTFTGKVIRGGKNPQQWLRYAMDTVIGIMLRDSPHTKSFPEYTRAIVKTRIFPTA